MSQPETKLEGWIQDIAANRAVETRVGLFVNSQRVRRQQLRALADDTGKESEIQLKPQVETATRYRYAVNNENGCLIQHTQHRIPAAADEFDTAGELLIEGQTDIAALPAPPADVIDTIDARTLNQIQRGEYSQLASPRAFRVAGLDAERKEIRSFLTESLADWGLRSERGMLLTGPPGTGKSVLVKAVCEELYGAIPETIEGSEVLSRWVGESEATLRRTFTRAQESPMPVLYIDEIDSIGRKRADSTQDYTAQIVSQLLVLLDGIESKSAEHNQPLKVIASTNVDSQLDPALTRPGRLGDRVLEVTRPTAVERKAIFHHYLECIDYEAGALASQLQQIAREKPETLPSELIQGTEQYTGADIERIVLAAARRAQRADAKLTLDHLYRAYNSTSDELPTNSANKLVGE